MVVGDGFSGGGHQDRGVAQVGVIPDSGDDGGSRRLGQGSVRVFNGDGCVLFEVSSRRR